MFAVASISSILLDCRYYYYFFNNNLNCLPITIAINIIDKEEALAS